MGFLDRIMGRDEQQQPQQQPQWGRPAPSSDEAAIERYRYLLRTAPPRRSSRRMRRPSPS
jgi:hypothetical protein